MTRATCLLTLALTLFASEGYAQEYTYAGIGLGSDLDSIAEARPESRLVGSYLYVAPSDATDHIYGIEVSTGAARRVRLGFERRTEDGPEYPTCSEVQQRITPRYGDPTSLEEFAEEASERSDRHWRGERETLILVCFRDGAGTLRAEAVMIYPR